jgi:type I restriction enzyme, S subunit
MSHIDKLLAGLCQQEIKFTPLWRLTSWDKKFNAVESFKQPRVLKYNYFLASDLKPLVVKGGDVKLLTTNTSDLWTTKELAGDLVSDGEVVAIPWGGNPNVQYFKGKFLTADNRIAVSNDTNILDTKFLYYFLQSQLLLLESFYRGSGIKHPSMAHVLDIKIPVPPLPIQQEIVKILDAFRKLEAELEAELEARRKQYEYYRDRLLDFKEAS